MKGNNSAGTFTEKSTRSKTSGWAPYKVFCTNSESKKIVFDEPDMIPHVLLSVQSFGTVLTLEPVVRHLVSFDHVRPQLRLQNVLHINIIFTIV